MNTSIPEHRPHARPAGLWRELRRLLVHRGGQGRRDFFFLHVQRTGGSSVWHSLAADAGARRMPLCDLYHLARQRPHPSLDVDDLIHNAREAARGRGCIFHVHDCVPLPHLDAPQSLAATVLRDPVDRHVSHVMHLRAVVNGPAVADRLLAALREEMGGEAMRLLKHPALPARDLILAMPDCYPMLRNHSVKWFSTVLGLRHDSSANPTVATPQAHVANLAREMRSRIALIGTHDDLEGFYVRLCRLIGLHPLPTRLTRSVNRGNERPLLARDDREMLSEAFALDRLLLDELVCHTATTPARASTGREHDDTADFLHGSSYPLLSAA